MTNRTNLDPARGELSPRVGHGLPLRAALLSAAALIALTAPHAAMADDISSGKTYKASGLGNSVNPDFKGGTLQLDTSTTISNNFSVENFSTNTIDIDGHTVVMSGVFSGVGPLTFTDSVAGGAVTLTNSGNDYTGATIVDSGAVLALSGSGTIADSSSLTDNGTFDISATTGGASLTSLSGDGTVTLGAQTLTVTSSSGTFSGVIAGTGGLTVSAGTQVLSGANTYTGGTTISAGALQIGAGGTTGSILGNILDNGTLAFDRSDDITFGNVVSGTGGLTQEGAGTLTLTGVNTYSGTTTVSSGTLVLSGSGSIANSSVTANGTFDVSSQTDITIKSLTGSGTVDLGSATLTLTNASGTFTGGVTGSGTIIVNGGAFGIGSATFANNVTDNASVAFNGAGTVTMSGIISGPGGLQQTSGTAILSSVETYSGATTITGGQLELSGNGSIASTSSVTVNGTFTILSANGPVTIPTLSGSGSVILGATDLVLANAAGSFSGVISGSGGLTLTSGNETLSGLNTFSGKTTVSGGTLVLGNASGLLYSSVVDNAVFDISQSIVSGVAQTASIVSLSGSGDVILGQNTLALSAANGTFSGTISGSGGLTLKSGSETLSGSNSYAGATTITGGTLILSGSNNLPQTTVLNDSGVLDISQVTAGQSVTIASLSGTGTLLLGDTDLTINSANTTFSGQISGTGQLVIAGGTETLSGTNSYSGGTVISGGTLQIGAGYVGGSITGDVADNGVLAFDRSDTLIFNGAITGGGSVTQSGSGKTILTGASSYTGGTTISAGTLQIGDGSTSGSITGTVVDNGTLAFDRTDTITFSGLITGTGGMVQLSGTTILTAAEQYTGTTVVDSLATLTLTGSGSIAQSSGVTVDGMLDASGLTTAPKLASLAGSGTVEIGGETLTITNGSGDFGGAINGTGGLTLTGGAGQTLSGTNGYSGVTAVNGGTLIVNGSIASSSGVTVASGATLGGGGTVSNVTLASGATIAPGSGGTGTLTVNGSVAFASDSHFVVETANGTAGKLSTTGAETLNGTLSVVSLDGSYTLGQKLTVLTAAGGISGSFDVQPITSSGAQYTTSVTYDAHDVYLQVNLAKLSPLLPAGSSRNAVNATAGIDAAIAAGNTLPAAFQDLGMLTATAYQADAGQLASEVGGDVPLAGSSLFDPFVTSVFDHVADMQSTGNSRSRLPQGGDIWGEGLVGKTLTASQSGDFDTHHMRSNLAGFVIGGDWNIMPNMVLGFAGSSGSSDFHLSDGVGQGKAKAVQFGVYGLVQYTRHLYGSFVGAVSLDSIHTTRTIDVSGTDVLTAKVDARMFGGRYETGVEMGWMTPYVALQGALFDASSAKETASSGSATYALTYAGHNTTFADAELGFRQRVDVPLDDWTLKLSDRFGWKLDMSGTPSAVAAFTALPNSSFTNYGASPGRNAALVSLGASLESAGGFGLKLGFDGDVASKSQTYVESVGLKYNW